MLTTVRATVPARYFGLAWVAALFLLINLLVRLGLIIFEGDLSNVRPFSLLPILVIGLLYDLAALSFLLAPFALVALYAPDSLRGRKVHAVLATVYLLATVAVILFTSVAEALFWNEFAARFNFIAVDYLIYTRETVGNVFESYDIGLLIAGLLGAIVVTFLGMLRSFWRAARAEGGSWRRRLVVSSAILLLPAVSFVAIGDWPRDLLPSHVARELAENGYYELVRAFRANDIDFQDFYATIPQAEAKAIIQQEFTQPGAATTLTGGANPVERRITNAGQPRPLNVVMVTIESLGSDYMESVGGRKGLTPNLDALGRDGMLFTRLYASGTRTVRGLEALSLSVPPTPGGAVVTRKNNKGFQTLGGVLKGEGYEPVFIYGGYSYFDNMQDFFGGNGYTVVDRTTLSSKDISHETIWGVADEDLFTMVLREVDARAAAGKKIFAQVMTTSNHRPFTYPAGRIDIPSGAGRDGAVKYTDWAIGKFMREAATRPWFKDTLFVFVADHTSEGRGRTDLPMENYLIPLVIYAPGHVTPARIDTLASQIDVVPTLLGLLKVSYISQFFGRDILTEGQQRQRAMMVNYLTVGLVENGIMVELSPKQRSRILDISTGKPLAADDPRSKAARAKAIAYFQVATDVLRGR